MGLVSWNLSFVSRGGGMLSFDGMLFCREWRELSHGWHGCCRCCRCMGSRIWRWTWCCYVCLGRAFHIFGLTRKSSFFIQFISSFFRLLPPLLHRRFRTHSFSDGLYSSDRFRLPPFPCRTIRSVWSLSSMLDRKSFFLLVWLGGGCKFHAM